MTHKDKDLRVRLSEKLHDALYRKAQSMGMNKSEWVRYVLRKELESDG